MKNKFIKEEKRIINSFKYAIEGIITAFKKENNMKIHVLIMTIIIICGFIFKISVVEWFICIIMFGLVLASELINTSIESTIDLVTTKIDINAKIAKDTAAGAVLIIAIASIIIGLVIFLPKILNLFSL